MNDLAVFKDLHNMMIDYLKQLLYHRHPTIFERLDFDNDSVYEESLLFAYVFQKDDKWLDGIIYGYEKRKPSNAIIYSNSKGVIYLPKIGYFITGLPNQKFELRKEGLNYGLYADGNSIDYEFEPILFIDYGIEILKYPHPLFERIMIGEGGAQLNSKITFDYKAHLTALRSGLHLIKKYNSDLFDMMRISLKKIIIYAANEFGSFASMTSQNLIYLNAKPWATRIYFADQVSHEAGHLVFFVLTFKSKSKMFKYPYYTMLKDIPGSNFTRGTVYLVNSCHAHPVFLHVHPPPGGGNKVRA